MAFMKHLGLTEDMPSADLKNVDNIYYVVEVAGACTNHMLKTESDLRGSTNCTSETQPELSDRMR